MVSVTLPFPRHFLQGVLIIWPCPPHRRHVDLMWKKPVFTVSCGWKPTCIHEKTINMDKVTNKLGSKGMYLFWDKKITCFTTASYNFKKVVFALSCCGHCSWGPNLTKQLWKSIAPNLQWKTANSAQRASVPYSHADWNTVFFTLFNCCDLLFRSKKWRTVSN